MRKTNNTGVLEALLLYGRIGKLFLWRNWMRGDVMNVQQY
jgi:hypothetical protein